MLRESLNLSPRTIINLKASILFIYLVS